MDLKKVWEKYRTGSKLSDKELQAIIKQADAALPYLQSRGPEFGLARKECFMDLLTLRGYMGARTNKRKRWL